MCIDITIESKRRVLVDRRIAQNIRDHYKMDKLDCSDETVKIFFPDTVLTLTSPFITTLFTKSLRKLKTVDAVLTKYKIISKHERIYEKIVKTLTLMKIEME